MVGVQHEQKYLEVRPVSGHAGSVGVFPPPKVLVLVDGHQRVVELIIHGPHAEGEVDNKWDNTQWDNKLRLMVCYRRQTDAEESIQTCNQSKRQPLHLKYTSTADTSASMSTCSKVHTLQQSLKNFHWSLNCFYWRDLAQHFICCHLFVCLRLLTVSSTTFTHACKLNKG